MLGDLLRQDRRKALETEERRKKLRAADMDEMSAFFASHCTVYDRFMHGMQKPLPGKQPAAANVPAGSKRGRAIVLLQQHQQQQKQLQQQLQQQLAAAEEVEAKKRKRTAFF